MRDNPLNRLRVLRGTDLPQAKLTDDDVRLILDAVEKRNDLRDYIRENLSNDALASKLGVHVRTIERVTQGYGWTHIDPLDT